jgi:hypothetical protein
VPKIVIWDKGSANQAHAVKALLRALEVQDIAARDRQLAREGPGRVRAEHGREGVRKPAAPGAGRQRGRAQCRGLRLVERLQREPDPEAGHAHPPRPVHVARFDLWMRIKESELRFLPDADQCRALLAGREETRKVMGELQITFKHPARRRRFATTCATWRASPSATVTVQPMLYGDCAVLASIASYDGTRREWKLEPIRDYDENGFRESAPVFGESFKANPQTIVEAAGKALDRQAFPATSPIEEIEKAKRKNVAPFDGLVDAHSHLSKVEIPTYLPRRGSEIAVPDRVAVDQAPLSRIAACKALVAMLGRPLTHDENRKVAVWYPDGVPEADLPQIAIALRTGTTPFRHLGDKEASA